MKFPKLVRHATIPVKVIITAEEPNEFGEKVVLLNKGFLCNYQDAATVKYTADKQASEITGTIYIDGDILPSAAVIGAGTVEIFGAKREIVKGAKARNFDGSVNYTRLDVK
jgi:hypothetical protein